MGTVSIFRRNNFLCQLLTPSDNEHPSVSHPSESFQCGEEKSVRRFGGQDANKSQDFFDEYVCIGEESGGFSGAAASVNSFKKTER